MKKQTVEKSLTIKGINTTFRREEGTCAEIINLRPDKNGQWSLMGEKEQVGLIDGTQDVEEIIKIHKHPVTTNRLIAYAKVQNENQIINIDITDGSFDTLKTVVGLRSFAHYGNLLIAYTETDRYYFLYKEGSYTELQDLLPAKIAVNVTEEHSKNFMNDQSTSYDGALGKLRKYIQDEENNGFIFGSVAIRTAFRLKNGEYIGYSEPLIINLSPTTATLVVTSLVRYYFLNIYTKKMEISIINTPETNATDYKEIIQSLDVFITNPYPTPIIPENDFTDGTAGTYSLETNNFETVNFKSEPAYYLLKSFNVPELEETETFETEKTLETNIALKTDQNTAHKILPNHTFLYNDSILMYDNKIKYSDGYENVVRRKTQGASNASFIFNYYKNFSPELNAINEADFQPTQPPQGYQLFWEYEGYVNQEKILTRKDIDASNSFFLAGQAYIIIFQKTVSYPSIGFNKATLHAELNNVRKILAEIKLQDHEFLNVSFGQFTNPVVFDIEQVYANKPQAEVKELEIFGNSRNTIRATQGGTPLLAPTPLVYSFGETSNIIYKVINQLSDISTGQYGTYPLYVFTSEGIYLLSVGSQDVMFDRVTYMSEDICDNPRLITNIENSIVYFDGVDLKVLTGYQSNIITLDINKNMDNNSLINSSDFNDIFTLNNVTELIPKLFSDSTLAEFLNDCIIFYDNQYKELYLSNYVYNYSLVYSFGVWYKYDKGFKFTFNNLNNRLITDNQNIYSLTETSNQNRPFFIQFNEMLNMNHYKVNDIKTDLKAITATFVGLFVFAGKLFSNGKKVNGNIEQINIKRINGSHKSVSLVITGIARGFVYTFMRYISTYLNR